MRRRLISSIKVQGPEFDIYKDHIAGTFAPISFARLQDLLVEGLERKYSYHTVHGILIIVLIPNTLKDYVLYDYLVTDPVPLRILDSIIIYSFLLG